MSFVLFETRKKASDTLKHQPRGLQYLTHAHSHITLAVAAMDSCFVLVRTHQHGIAPGQVSLTITDPAVYCQGECTSTPLSASSISYAMLMSPNKDETAVHGCHCQGDMAVRMRKVLQTAGLVFECVTCFFRVSL